MTVQSVDSDEPIDKQKLIQVGCKLDKILNLGLRTKYYIERHWKLSSPIFVMNVSNKHEYKLDTILRNFYQRHFSWISTVSEVWAEKVGVPNIIIN